MAANGFGPQNFTLEDLARGQVDPATADQERLARLLGLEPPKLQSTDVEQFQGGSPFLEQFGQSLGQLPAPRGFLSGLAFGAARGLASQGRGIAEKREEFEKQAQARAKAAAEANLEATREFKKTLGERAFGLQKGAAEQRIKQQEKQEELNRTSPVVDDVLKAQYPSLKGLPNGRRVSPEVFKQAQLDLMEEQGGGLGGLTPGGRDIAAKMFGVTGQLPPMGRGKKAQKARVGLINRAAEIYGPDLDIASNKADFESNREALKVLQRINNSAEAFAKTVEKNSGILKSSLKRAVDTGQQWLNAPVREVLRQTGDPDIQEFRTALQVVVPEYTRLLNSPTATGVISDSAREETKVILDPNSTVRQILRSLDVLEKDAQNRMDSYRDQIKIIKRDIRAIGSSESRGGGGNKKKTLMELVEK